MGETRPELEELAEEFAADLSLAVWRECDQSYECGYSAVDVTYYAGEGESNNRIEQVGFADLDCRSDACPYGDPDSWSKFCQRIALTTASEINADCTDVRVSVTEVSSDIL